MALTRDEKRKLADRIKAHVISLIESDDGLDDFLDSDYVVREDVREQIGMWMSRLPGDFWSEGDFGPRRRL